MRREAITIIALATALAGCGAVRGPSPMEPSPVAAHTARPSRDGRAAIQALPAHAQRSAAAPAPMDDRALVCVDDPRIDGWEDRLRASSETTALLERGAEFVPRLKPILLEEGVAPALALLPAIESSFRIDALSSRGARGLWQLRAATAREHGLVVTRRRDDRLHVERSTRAAAMFLARLRERYGEWPLALAAYNAGPGRVDRALALAGGDASFWELVDGNRLPAESAEYVPRVIALIRVAHDDGCRGMRAGRTGAGVLVGAR